MSKYKVGDKFVVEIDKVLSDVNSPFIGSELYRIKGFNSLVFDEFGLDKLDKCFPEKTTDEYDDGYVDGKEKGMDEAWETAKKIILSEDVEHYSYEELEEIFGDVQRYGVPGYEVFRTLTPQEAKAKIEEWEETKKIRVGDVVTDTSNNRNYIVTGIKQDNNSTWYALLSEIGLTINTKACTLKKTGRHIDIQSILEQIGGKK